MIDDKILRHLPLDALRTFTAAARLGNFTRAGEEVHRTQSAVSMQIKRLETELGRSLFERKGRSVLLTVNGEILLSYALRLLRLHDQALADLTSPTLTGVIRLGVPDDYATTYLPSVLAQFVRTYPKVRIDIRCDTTADLLADLLKGHLDLCIATGDGSSSVPLQGCTEVSLARLPLVWMGADQMEPEDIWDRKAPLPVAVFHDGCPHRRWALEALERANIPYRIAVSSLSLAAIQAAVRSGLAISPVTLGSLGNGYRTFEQDLGLPKLPSVTVGLHSRKDSDGPTTTCLARFLGESFKTL